MVKKLVIPAEAEPAPHLIRGIQILKILVPRFRGDDAWIPVFTGMTEKVNRQEVHFKELRCYLKYILWRMKIDNQANIC